jgi:hypothetical protein
LLLYVVNSELRCAQQAAKPEMVMPVKCEKCDRHAGQLLVLLHSVAAAGTANANEQGRREGTTRLFQGLLEQHYIVPR